MCNGHDGNKNNLRTIEAQIVQELKNNEAPPKFTCSYKKKACKRIHIFMIYNDFVIAQRFCPKFVQTANNVSVIL